VVYRVKEISPRVGKAKMKRERLNKEIKERLKMKLKNNQLYLYKERKM